MKKYLIWGVVLLGIWLSPIGIYADVVLAPHSEWEYTFADPTGDGTWNTTTDGWTTGDAPFGNNTGGNGYDPLGYFDYNTFWPADTSFFLDDLWVRTTIDLTGYDLSSISWDLGVDNGFKLYVNGTLVSADLAELYTFRWEYSGYFPSVTLNQGHNVIALALNDWGALTAFDMQITGSPEPTIDAILEFFDNSVAAGTLIGDGPGNSANGRLYAIRNMLEMAGDLINIDDIEGACGQLNAAIEKCDGYSPPPDFVTGEATPELHYMIVELMEYIECE